MRRKLLTLGYALAVVFALTGGTVWAARCPTNETQCQQAGGEFNPATGTCTVTEERETRFGRFTRVEECTTTFSRENGRCVTDENCRFVACLNPQGQPTSSSQCE